MNLKLELPKLADLKPRIVVIGVGGAGGNAVNNMIAAGLDGVEFVVANTDAQSLAASSAEHKIQLGVRLTEGLGAGARPEIGEAAAEEVLDEIRSLVSGAHMVFVAAGMGGGTGTGAAGVIARAAKSLGILTVGVVTKPFLFEGQRRMRVAEAGVAVLRQHVDTLIVIPNQNLFRIANERTTFAEAFVLADQVLYSGIACIVDLIVKDGLINLDFADVRTIMLGMGSAMMGTGEASGERRATLAAEEAIANPLLDDVSLKGARGLLLSITGGRNLTLYEVDEAASRVRKEVDPEANIIVGATFDETLGEKLRVSIVASGLAKQGAAVDPAGSASRNAALPQHAPRSSFAPHFGAPGRNEPPAPARFAPSHAGSVPPPVPPHAGNIRHDSSPEAAELTRALSEAIEQAAMDDPGSARPQWRSAEGALFEEGTLQLGGMSPPPTSSRGAYEDTQAYAPQFEPAAPLDVRHGARRMPMVEDFPVVGQREYRAKMGIPEPPEGDPPPRKPTLFERLTGARRRESERSASAGHQHSRPDRRALSRIAAEDADPSERGSAADDPQLGQHSVETSVNFGLDRKR
jgi:cell division protein FtsZ